MAVWLKRGLHGLFMKQKKKTFLGGAGFLPDVVH
jgi:hypothetical protein